MKTINKLEEGINGLVRVLSEKLADKSIRTSTDEIISLETYIEMKLLLTTAWLTVTDETRSRLDGLTRAFDQLDRALTGAETMRFRSKYC